MNTFVVIAAVVAVLSLPVMYLIEWRFGNKRWMKGIHVVSTAVGVLITVLNSLLLNELASNFRTPYLGDWVKDFYFGYMWAALPAVLVVTILLCLAAAIRHPMIKIRKILTVLVSVAAVVTAFGVAFFSENEDFAVDFYIRILGIGMSLIPHAVSLCERNSKNTKK